MTGTADDILRLKSCPQCGYDLAGLPGAHACEECGFQWCDQTFSMGMVSGMSGRSLIAWYVGAAIFLVGATTAFLSPLPSMQRRWLILFPMAFVVMILGRFLFDIDRWRSGHGDMAYRRLIIAPDGYAIARGVRIIRRRPWRPTHRIRFEIIGRLYRLTIEAAERRWPFRTEFRAIIRLEKAQQQVVKQRIERYIEDASVTVHD